MQNDAQRLFRTVAVIAGIVLLLFPPFLVRQRDSWWVSWAPAWEQPYPTQAPRGESSPYCPDGTPSVMFLLIEMTVLVVGSSMILERLGAVPSEAPSPPRHRRTSQRYGDSGRRRRRHHSERPENRYRTQ